MPSWFSAVGPGTFFTAIGTVIGAIVTAFFAGRRLLKELAQNRKAMQAQTFVTLVNSAHAVQLSATMDVIRSLRYGGPGGPGYVEFKDAVSAETQARIRDVIDFFNDLQHMVDNDYLTQQHVVSLYHVSILDCADRLLPWWVEGFRAEHQRPYYYGSFVRLCTAARNLEGRLNR